MGKCDVCGRERSLGVERFAGVCDTCELEIRARSPSEELHDMRLLYNGQRPSSPGAQMLQNIFLKSPKQFLELKKAAEDSYRLQVAALVKERPREQDAGALKSVDLLKRLLEERGWEDESLRGVHGEPPAGDVGEE